MLQTNDIGILFSRLRAAYGYQWSQTADDIPVWQSKLKDYDAKQVEEATNRALDLHRDHPPSVGQFRNILDANKRRPNTMIEDKRPPGRMPFAEWKKQNGVDT
jgi:hypothetical protein